MSTSATLLPSTTRWCAEAEASLRHGSDAEYQIQLDLRYVGQEFTLSVPVTLAQLKAGDRRAIRTAFDALYEHRYAHHSPEEPVEMVNIRLAAIGKRAKLAFPAGRRDGAAAKPAGEREVYFSSAEKPVRCPVYRREELAPAPRIAGPALIQEHGTTTVLFESDAVRGGAFGRADHRGGARI